MRAMLVLGLSGVVAGRAAGVVVFSEATGGDLSDDPLAPTPLVLPEGVGSVIAQVDVTTDQQDWFSVTIPAGFQLSALWLADYDSSDPVAFAGFAGGAQFRGDYQNPGAYWGYSHIGDDSRFTDILPLLANQAVNPGSTGFEIPLSAGTYTFIVQQTGGPTVYQLDFEVTAVPTPGVFGPCAIAAAVLARRRVRKSSSLSL